MRILSELRGQTGAERETRQERRERTRWDPSLSLWTDRGRRLTFPAPNTDLDVDVVVVGAGFTGLWSAAMIAEQSPGTSVAVLEAAQPGFGASGRNGGWCSALLPATDRRIAATFGADAVHALRSAAVDAVDDIGRYASDHGIECGWAKGGSLTIATNAAQLERIRNAAATDSRLQFLATEELRTKVVVDGARGAVHDPECAAIDPVALIQGLVDRCISLGVRIFGATRVVAIRPDHVIAEGAAGLVYATTRQVIVATEAYLSRMRHQRRRIAPLYSFVVATDPLPASAWDSIGWAARETVAEAGHMVSYAQRTADGRIVFGGRGAPYPFRSDIHAHRDSDEKVFASIVARLNRMFPATRDVRISHRWGGPLGVPRDRLPGVWVDPRTNAIHAGGYTGDGVALSHLLARIVAGKVCGTSDPAGMLPLNGHMPPKWEPEPLRWAGLNFGLFAASRADSLEEKGSVPRAWQRVLDRL